MARTRSLHRSSQKRSLTSSRARYLLIANNPLLPRKTYNNVRSQQQLLLDLARLSGSDNRSYSPIPSFRPARTAGGRIASHSIPKQQSLRRAKPQFSIPSQVALCVRRGIRKEVIFAKKHSGRNGQKTSRRNFYSTFSC